MGLIVVSLVIDKLIELAAIRLAFNSNNQVDYMM